MSLSIDVKQMRNWNTFIKIDKRNKTPLYHQIIENFRTLIKERQLEPGEMTPSEWELSDLYGVSRLTVRRAIDDLERDGLLVRRHGVGTFVANPTEAQIYPSELSFTKNMEQIGRTPGSRVVSLQIIPASAAVAQQLEIETDAPVFELVRVRLVDGAPLMLETTYLSQARFPQLPEANLSEGSLYTFLRMHYQVDIVAMDQVMEPTLLTDREAAWLEVEPGSPAILSEIIGFTANGEAVEYTWSVTCGGRGRFYFYFREGDIGKRHFTERRAAAINRR
ncbi:MAG: GntR family transcriptional regulator [Chloroflexota bacterium]